MFLGRPVHIYAYMTRQKFITHKILKNNENEIIRKNEKEKRFSYNIIAKVNNINKRTFLKHLL